MLERTESAGVPVSEVALRLKTPTADLTATLYPARIAIVRDGALVLADFPRAEVAALCDLLAAVAAEGVATVDTPGTALVPSGSTFTPEEATE